MIVILVKIISRLFHLGKLQQDVLVLLPFFKATSVPKALFHSGIIDFVKRYSDIRHMNLTIHRTLSVFFLTIAKFYDLSTTKRKLYAFVTISLLRPMDF